MTSMFPYIERLTFPSQIRMTVGELFKKSIGS